MKRIDTSTKAVDLFGSGKHGFQNSNLGLGVPATDFNADWTNHVQEEICSVIEADGTPINPAKRTQMLEALSGRLKRILVYQRVGGVQMVSINGAAPTAVGASAYAKAQGAVYVVVEAQGAGSAAAGCTLPAVGNVSAGAPGMAGAYGVSFYLVSALAASVSITVGAKGVGTTGAAGTSGGTSSFGALLSAPGGVGGGMLNNQAPPVVNGNSSFVSATGANLFRIDGTSVFPSIATGTAPNGNVGGTGGASPFGAGATGAAGNNVGRNTPNFGAGGSGSVINNGYGGTTPGGDGGEGVVIVREYA